MADVRHEPCVEETAPLLPRDAQSYRAERLAAARTRGVFPALLTAFMTSLSFGVTQVPILFIFRVMACDAYYTDHDLSQSPERNCNIREITSRTAREVAIIGMSTTIFGVANLLVTGWCIKKLGVKRALLIQVFWPAMRLAIQNVGAMTGGSRGIIIMQASQIITIIGGPNGYVLALNSFITDVVQPEERTGALGRIQGCMMMGMAVGFLVGGVLGDAFGILAPFRVTLLLFLLCCAYVAVALPYIPSEQKTSDAKDSPVGFKRFLGPLRIFTPQKWTLRDGRTSRQYGALMLAIGVFLAILATGYLVTLLQMYATTQFSFGTTANGYLTFMYSSLRGLYLTFIFPRIINLGRRWMQPKDAQAMKIETTATEVAGTSPNEVEIADAMDAETEPLNPPKRENEEETFAFDLLYARCSLLADGILTGLCVFVSEGWQMYMIAFLLPLAAGTGSASKGSILQMIPSKDRVDALSGITLVESAARLSTVSVFGFVFAALADVGKSHLVFVCNAGVALVGFVALLFSHFPPEGAKRVEG